MTENPLEGEISASVELTETGAKGALKSRLANAIDWAGGTWIFSKFQGHSNKNDERAAINAARMALIKESGEIALTKLRENPELAAPFIKAEFGLEIQRSENRVAAIEYMMEDIRSNPPTDKDSETGPEQVSPDTLNRWGRYAEDAKTDELRQHWGRILSAEIRRPGTLSPKLMRIMDEVDTQTAIEFQEFCKNSFSGMVPVAIVDDLEFSKKNRFVQADLIVDPGIVGHYRVIGNSTSPTGTDFKILQLDEFAIAWEANSEVFIPPNSKFFTQASQGLSINVYLLTTAGDIISKLIDRDRTDAFNAIYSAVSQSIKSEKILRLRTSGEEYVDFD